MKSLMKKVRGNKKGFTLAELLVVVAIVGILVAISIPVFTSQLSKARKATNQANMRAAKAAAVAQYLTDNEEGKTAVLYVYNLEKGIAEKTADAVGNDYEEVTIDSASKDVKYTGIKVSVQAGTIETEADGTTSTDTSNAAVRIYVTPKSK